MAAWLDRCRFLPTLGGTTDWVVNTPVTGYQTPALAGVSNARVYKFVAESADLTQWEICEGPYTTGTNTFARTTVLYNSSGTGTASGQSGAGTKINFASIPNVAIVAVKEDMISIEEANAFTAAQKTRAQLNINFGTIIAPGTDLNTVQDQGTYACTDNSCTNGPYAGGQWYIDVVAYSNDPTNYLMQRATSLLGPSGGVTVDEAVWTRVKLAGTYQPWRRTSGARKGHLWGLTMSTAGASTTLTVGVGQCSDGNGVDIMDLLAATAKTTSAWAVGTAAGGLDTGSIAANTTYHWYVIKRPDTGVVDITYSLNASAPTLPTNYTISRRIGSMPTNGSSQWTNFKQYEDSFYLQTPVTDSTTSPGTTDTLFTLSVPTGIRVKPMVHLAHGTSASGESSTRSRVPDLQTTETGVGSTVGTSVGLTTNVTRGTYPMNMDLWTNTSAQINIIASIAQTVWAVRTYGWVDTRGRLG